MSLDLYSVALDKIDFMPLLSVDANSGVIVTDWYSFDAGETRIKINIRVLNEELNDDEIIYPTSTFSFSNPELEQKIKLYFEENSVDIKRMAQVLYETNQDYQVVTLSKFRIQELTILLRI